MTNYQKAIKVRKVCINKMSCYECDYCLSCYSSNIIKYSPVNENIETVTKAIIEEKWKVK